MNNSYIGSDISLLGLSETDLAQATPEELAELLPKLAQFEFFQDKRRARDLVTFARAAWKRIEPGTELKWNWHLDLIAEYLQLVRAGSIRRLIINVPPQTTKSRFVTVFFPAWWWSTDPTRRFMCASYSGGATGLATLHSNERRRILDSEWFGSVAAQPFGWTQFTAQQYENDCGGRMIATSPSGTATGKGVHCIILDDLINPKQAESEADRLAAIAFIDQTLRSRLSDQITGSMIVVEQRLHEQDVTGHLLAKEPGVWTHVSLPMVAEEDEEIVFPISHRVINRSKGDLLIPDRFPQWVVDSLKLGLGTRYFCTPGFTPILMSDWSEKSIERVAVGDEVIGYKLGHKTEKARLVRSKVIAKNEIQGFVVKLTTESGREIFCTPDHKWYRRMRSPGKPEYLPAAIGSVLHSVYTSPRDVTSEEQRDFDWLGGILDGEGSCSGRNAIFISQSHDGNAEVWGEVGKALSRLGIPFGSWKQERSPRPKWNKKGNYWINGSRSTKLLILKNCRMAKRQRFIDNLWRSAGMLTEEEGRQKIVSINPVGWMTVYGLTTETGNYVAWGFASQNSAQYQQRPTPAEGVIFNPGHWKYYTRGEDSVPTETAPRPPRYEIVGISVDCTFKESTESDNVAIHVYGGVGPRNYLIEKDTCRRGYAATKNAIKAKKKLYPQASVCIIEDKANGSAVIEELRREATGMSIIAIEPAGGKTARAWAAQPDQEAGNSYLPIDDDETVLFIDLMSKFRGEGSVAHDDDVDAYTQWVNWRRMHSLGFFAWAQERAEEIKAGKKSPTPNGSNGHSNADPEPVVDPATIARVNAQAGMSTAISEGGSVSRVFGAQVQKVSQSTMSKPRINNQTPVCPVCKNPALTRGEDARGAVKELCGRCGWKTGDVGAPEKELAK